MKKKLIAIVASLAMVATMVPATAFATTTPSKVTVEPIDASMTSADVKNDRGYLAALTANGTLKGNLDNITFMSGGSKVVAKGSLPYKALAGFSTTTESLNKGNYIGIVATLTNGNNGTELNNWYLKTEGTHTVDSKVYKTTDLVKVENTEGLVQRLEAGKVTTLELYNVADSLVTNQVWYTDATIADAPASVTVKSTSELTSWLNGKTALKVTLDTTGVTVLSEDETEALEDFEQVLLYSLL